MSARQAKRGHLSEQRRCSLRLGSLSLGSLSLGSLRRWSDHGSARERAGLGLSRIFISMHVGCRPGMSSVQKTWIDGDELPQEENQPSSEW